MVRESGDTARGPAHVMFVLDAPDSGTELFARRDAGRVQAIIEAADRGGLSNLTIIEEFSGPTTLTQYFKEIFQAIETKMKVSNIDVMDEERIAFQSGTRLEVTMIASYQGKSDVVASMKKVLGGSDAPNSENFEAAIGSGLQAGKRSEPDLIVFFGGRRRVGEVGVWIGAYSEMAFLDKPWLSFTADDLTDLLADFGLRERRFGAV